MELDLYGLADYLIEGHVKGALAGDENALRVVVVVFSDFGYFEPEVDLSGEGMIFHEDGQKELFEFVIAEGL